MSRISVIGAVVLALAAPVAVAAGIELAGPAVAGEPVELRVVVDGQGLAGAAVIATYHPRSRVAREEPVGETGADGRLAWRPRAAGLVRLEVRGAAADPAAAPVALRDLGVRYPRPSRSGLTTLLLAAAILAAGLLAGLGAGTARLARGRKT